MESLLETHQRVLSVGGPVLVYVLWSSGSPIARVTYAPGVWSELSGTFSLKRIGSNERGESHWEIVGTRLDEIDEEPILGSRGKV